MSKVWNITGSFFGSSTLLPEGSIFKEIRVVIESSQTIYYDGDLFNLSRTFFRATFETPEQKLVYIDIPSKQMEPLFDVNTPLSNPYDDTYSTRTLSFQWEYEGQKPVCSFEIQIWPGKFTVQSIEVIVPPNKTIYYDGEYFDHEGMVVSAKSEEGDEKELVFCGQYSCTPNRDCYYYNHSPLHSGDTETVNIEFTYCLPNGPTGTGTAKFSYPVTVYKDSKKPVLRVTYTAEAQNQIYYSGSTFNASGIKVEAKYPREDDSTYQDVTSSCKIYVQEFPNGTLQYTPENNGRLTVQIEYTDSQTSTTSYATLEDTVFVYEVSAVNWTTATKSDFKVGDIFSKSYVTLKVDYKPSDVKSSITTNNYTWRVVSGVIDSSGKLQSVGNNQTITLLYTDPADLYIKKVWEVPYQINVGKQVVKMNTPSYTGSTTYSGTSGIAILTSLGITNSNGTLKTGYGSVRIGSSSYTGDLGKYKFTASASQNTYVVQVSLDTSSSQYEYQWPDGSTGTKSVTVTLRRSVTVNLGSSISLSNSQTSDYTSFSTSGYDSTMGALQASINGNASSYCSVRNGSSITSTSGTIYVDLDSVLDQNTTITGTLNLQTTGSANWFTGDSDSCNITIRFERQWSWDDPLSSSWVSGLKENNPSNYIGRYKSGGQYNFYLLHVSGSTLTWGFWTNTAGQFKTSSQSFSNWSSGGYSGTGGVQIQRIARNHQSTVASYFGTPTTQTRYYKYDNSSWYSCSMRCWPPTAEEMGFSIGGRIYSAHSGNNTRFSAGNVFSGTYWLGNGAWANDGSCASNEVCGASMGNVAVGYNSSLRSTSTVVATTSNWNYAFCFKV